MKTSNSNRKPEQFTYVLIWTILNQDLIAHHIRIYTYSAVAIIMLLTISQIISLDMALFCLFGCGLVFGLGLWVAIERRRSWLLGVTDPILKKEIYSAMLAYLACKSHDGKRDGALSSKLKQHELKQTDINKKRQSFNH